MKTLDPSDVPGTLPEPHAITDFLLYRLYRILTIAGGTVTRLCEGKFHVTRREWRVLAILAVHGPVSSAELAIRSSLDRPTTSKALSSLVVKGLACRRSRGADARFNGVALTEKGRTLYGQMFPAISDVSVQLLAPFSVEDIQGLDSLLSQIQARADSLARSSISSTAEHQRIRGRRGTRGA